MAVGTLGKILLLAPALLFNGVIGEPVPQFSCPVSDGVFANPANCLTFYRCVGGKATLDQCSSSLHFNPKIGDCDWPLKATCEPGEYEGSTFAAQPGPPGPVPSGVVCPSDDGVWRIPDPESCSSYYQCTYGVPQKRLCADGLYYNPLTQVCDYKHNVKCQFKASLPLTDRSFKCPSIFGLFPDPKSCGHFYHCSHNIPYHKNCPANLHFNPRLRVCDWPDRAGCGGGGDPVVPPPPGGSCDCDCCLITDWNDCTKYFLCLNKKKHHMDCPKGLYFNHKTENCDKKENLDRWCSGDGGGDGGGVVTTNPICKHGDGHYKHPDCRKFYHCSNGIAYVKDCPSILHWSVERDRCEWPCIAKCDPSVPPCNDGTTSGGGGGGGWTTSPICKDGDGHYPHPDCTKFYHCSNGIAYVKDCPKPLHWSIARDRCEWPCIAQCDPKVPPCPDRTTPATPTPTPSQDATTECITPTTPPPVCTDGELRHIDGNCSCYERCKGGAWILHCCCEGLHYNRVKKICDHPNDAGCLEEPECPCKCCFYPDDCDCNRYYVCLDGKLHHERCGDNLVFDPAAETCNFAHNVNRTCPPVRPPTFGPPVSTRPPTPTRPPPTRPPPTRPPPPTSSSICKDGDGHYPHPECPKFYHCSNGIAYVKNCPAGLHFSVKWDRCEWPCIAQCDPNVKPCPTEPPPKTTDRPGPGCPCSSCLVHDPSDCSSYYQCVNGSPQSKRCPHGQLFDREKKRCAPRGSVDCPSVGDPELCKESEGTYPLPGRCSNFVVCVGGVAHIKQCPANTEFNPDVLVCDWPSKACGGNSTVDKRCPKPTGLFAHKDCTKFYHCDHGIAYVKDCPASLHFSPRLKVCDWPNRAGCGGPGGDEYPGEDEFVWGCKEAHGIKCPACSCRVPDYDNCSKFYQCTSKGVACEKTCPEGLHFNKVTHVCDFPSSARCLA